ncbi:MAG TPA: hypothetical protein VHW23_45555 [Kofleriaceae bacterium]|nr:hypothetical protein [Kofleriaceae bacterium]
MSRRGATQGIAAYQTAKWAVGGFSEVPRLGGCDADALARRPPAAGAGLKKLRADVENRRSAPMSL